MVLRGRCIRLETCPKRGIYCRDASVAKQIERSFSNVVTANVVTANVVMANVVMANALLMSRLWCKQRLNVSHLAQLFCAGGIDSFCVNRTHKTNALGAVRTQGLLSCAVLRQQGKRYGRGWR